MTRTPVGRVNSSVAREPTRRAKGDETSGTTEDGLRRRDERERGAEEKARESRARITNSDGGGEVAGCTMSERETRKLNWQAQVALKPDYPSLVLNYLLAASAMSLVLAPSLSIILSLSPFPFSFFCRMKRIEIPLHSCLQDLRCKIATTGRMKFRLLDERRERTYERRTERRAGRKIGNASRAERESNRFQELVVSRFTGMRERYESAIFPTWAPLSRTPPLYSGISQSRTPLSGLSPYRLKHGIKNDQVLRIEISGNAWWGFCRNIWN